MAHLQRLVVAANQIHQQQIVLTPEQHHYLSRVLRLRQSDRLVVLDGQGHCWLVQLVAVPETSDLLQAQILEEISHPTELAIAITLVAALPKGNGFDDVVRQATELGVTCITPIISDRTLLNPGPQKLERWQRIAQEAAEQSERQIVPRILSPVPFKTWLQDQSDQTIQSTKFIAVTRLDCPHLLNCLLQRDFTSSEGIVVAIGPEGGWTETEIELAIAAGYQPVSLGARILRAVTAPIVALSIIAAAQETKR